MTPPAPPYQDLDPWVTAPIFEDECNSMDPIGAMVSGRPPFAAAGSDGSSTGPRDCPSPPRGRPGDGPLDGLCESWEGPEEEGLGREGTGAGAEVGTGDVVISSTTGGAGFGLAPADAAASMQEFRQSSDGLAAGVGVGASGGQAGGDKAPPEEEELRAPSPSRPAFHQAHATAPGPHQGEEEPASSTTPPPVPAKPAAVTTAFLLKEGGAAAGAAGAAGADHLALYGGPNEPVGPGAAGAAADAVAPGTVSSQDLLLEWLRREAGRGDEEAQFHLAQLFSPPRFEMKPECRECGEAFGVTRYRHHCRHCGGSFCHEHAWHEHPIPKLGLPAAQVWCHAGRPDGRPAGIFVLFGPRALLFWEEKCVRYPHARRARTAFVVGLLACRPAMGRGKPRMHR